VSSPLTLKTFYNRMTRCYYFKERSTYLKNASLLFKKVLLEFYQNSTKTFLQTFSKNFTYRVYTGKNSIYSIDRNIFKDFCATCAINLSEFLQSNYINKIHDKYVFCNQIYGYIDGIIEKSNISIQFSFKNSIETQKDIDFYILNNYIYNIMKQTCYDTIVMSVPTGSYFKVKFDRSDYTILRRGYLKSVINSKMRRRGDYCLHCINKCKPNFINKLERLEILNDGNNN